TRSPNTQVVAFRLRGGVEVNQSLTIFLPHSSRVGHTAANRRPNSRDSGPNGGRLASRWLLRPRHTPAGNRLTPIGAPGLAALCPPASLLAPCRPAAAFPRSTHECRRPR